MRWCFETFCRGKVIAGCAVTARQVRGAGRCGEIRPTDIADPRAALSLVLGVNRGAVD